MFKKTCLLLLVVLVATTCAQDTVGPEAPSPPPTLRQEVLYEDSYQVDDSRKDYSDILAIILPKFQHIIGITMANIAQAVTGAIATTVTNGFKPLKITFIPYGKSSTPGFTIDGPDGKPLVYMGDASTMIRRETKPEPQRTRP